MPTSFTRTLYYYGNELITNTSVKYNTEVVGCLGYKQLQNTVIYDTTITTGELSGPIGNAFFDISVLKIPDGTDNTVYDTELSYFMFTTGSGSQTDTIAFTIALYNPGSAGFLSSGSYTFEITSGSGTYLGAVGSVVYVINSDGLRTVTITGAVP